MTWESDVLDTLNAMYNNSVYQTTLQEPIPGLEEILLAIVFALTYPVIVLGNLLYEDLSVIWTVFYGLVTIFSKLQDFFSTLVNITIFQAFPSSWTSLILGLITLAIIVRLIRLVKWILAWIPILNLGGR